MQPRPSLDDLRAARPDLSLALYAMDPGGEVTLEIYADGQVYAYKAATEADAILAAFPPPQETETQPEAPPPDRSIFD